MQGEGDSEFHRRKEELEQKIKALEEERVSLTAAVESLRQRRTLLELEKRAKSGEETVEILRRQKEDLEAEILEKGESAAGEGQQIDSAL